MDGDKGSALLAFLKATAIIRRKRIISYGPADKVLWLSDVPRERPEVRSPFLSDRPYDLGELWLEFRKKRMPAPPPVPQVVTNWVRADDLDQPENEPKLLSEITLIVERRLTDPDAPKNLAGHVVPTYPFSRKPDILSGQLHG